jgi:RNA polymerase sigma-70 factor (ECF subfamily)
VLIDRRLTGERRDTNLLQDVLQESIGPQAKINKRNVPFQDASEEWFEQIFLEHYANIVGVLRRMVGDRTQAEDLATEAFLKLYQRLSVMDSGSNIGGWLYRTATNLGIDALRAATRRNQYELAAGRADAEKPREENALDLVLRMERQHRVRAVLAELKPAQAQLLLLRASGHSYKELADSLGVEPGSVGTLLIRAEGAFEERYLQMFGREEEL